MGMPEEPSRPAERDGLVELEGPVEPANLPYVRMFREVYVDRIRRAVEKIGGALEETVTPTEAFSIIGGVEDVCQCLECSIIPTKDSTEGPKDYLFKVEVPNGGYRTLGEAVVDFRNQVGLTQKALAKLLGMTGRTIFRLEKGEGATEKTIGPLLQMFRILPERKAREIYNLPVKP